MSNEPNINDIGAQVKALIVDMKRSEGVVEQTRKLAQPLLRQVWDALERGETVALCKSKTEFAKYAGVSMRYCQFILKDGSRKRSDANPVRILMAYPDDISFHKRKLTAYIGIDKLNDDNQIVIHDVSGSIEIWVECDSKHRREALAALGEKVKDTVKRLRLWTKEFAKEWKAAVARYVEFLPSQNLAPSSDSQQTESYADKLHAELLKSLPHRKPVPHERTLIQRFIASLFFNPAVRRVIETNHGGNGIEWHAFQWVHQARRDRKGGKTTYLCTRKEAWTLLDDICALGYNLWEIGDLAGIPHDQIPYRNDDSSVPAWNAVSETAVVDAESSAECKSQPQYGVPEIVTSIPINLIE